MTPHCRMKKQGESGEMCMNKCLNNLFEDEENFCKILRAAQLRQQNASGDVRNANTLKYFYELCKGNLKASKALPKLTQ